MNIEKAVFEVARQAVEYLKDCRVGLATGGHFIQHAEDVLQLARAIEIGANSEHSWGLFEVDGEGWAVEKDDYLEFLKGDNEAIAFAKKAGLNLDEDGFLVNRQGKRIQLG